MTEDLRVHRTRTSYDTVAVDYQRLLGDLVAITPMELGMLAAFAGEVGAAGRGPLGDLGCGTGRMTAHLKALGADVFGIDLSPGMIEVARDAHPGLRFEVGSMAALDLPDASLGGVLSWFSTVHAPEDELAVFFAEYERVLAPGGLLCLGFKVGDERVSLERAYGHEVALDVYRYPPDRIAGLLTDAGFVETARLVRAGQGEMENTPQGFLLARKPA
ncbi:class I SAM-dependent methyltransferase [Streptomyces sp. NPDC090127]|uniref:class I SAM-dependent methyltransferase n=1 Tax=Streptomyces sp. NPDC090127 TaxID=3365953 RepID=UPI0037F6BF4F